MSIQPASSQLLCSLPIKNSLDSAKKEMPFSKKPISLYFGQDRIARIITEYCECPRFKDTINRFFTALTPAINSLNPKSVFWGLKDHWWLQLIDGCYHKYGPNVFDEGFHGKDIEPGYLSSGKAASALACEHLLQPLDVPFYKALHKTACSHFNKKGGTLMTAEETGRFIATTLMQRSSRCDPPSLFAAQLGESQRKAMEILKTESMIIDYNLEKHCDPSYLENLRMTEQEFRLKVRGLKKTAKDFITTEIEPLINKINAYIEERSTSLGMSYSFARINEDSTLYGHDFIFNIWITYYVNHPTQIKLIVDRLFKEFHAKMASADTQREKLIHIADLFQVLEWIHPFHDGQGRTDLILLSKLLCQYDFNPAILKEPYASTFCCLHEWVNYLQDGIENWQKEFIRQEYDLVPV